MNTSPTVYRVLSIFGSLGIFYFWFNDLVSHGYFRQADLFYIIWFFPLVLSLLMVIFWKEDGLTRQNINEPQKINRSSRTTFVEGRVPMLIVNT
jgi:hypothetical protein